MGRGLVFLFPILLFILFYPFTVIKEKIKIKIKNVIAKPN